MYEKPVKSMVSAIFYLSTKISFSIYHSKKTQYFQNICLYASKINGFESCLLRTFLSFSLSLHSKKNGHRCLNPLILGCFGSFIKLDKFISIYLYIIRKTVVMYWTIVKSMLSEIFNFVTFYFYISIHSKKNGSTTLKPSKIKGFKYLT